MQDIPYTVNPELEAHYKQVKLKILEFMLRFICLYGEQIRFTSDEQFESLKRVLIHFVVISLFKIILVEGCSSNPDRER